jgi:hypothetical protein
MIEFSASLASKGLPTHIESQDDLDTLIKAFAERVKELKFYEYYVIDVTASKASCLEALASGQVVAQDGISGKTVVELAELVRNKSSIQGYKQYASRYGTKVDGAAAASLVLGAFSEIPRSDHAALAEAWGRIVDVINVPLYEEWEEDEKVAIASIKDRVRYTRLDAHGPRLGEIKKKLGSVSSPPDKSLTQLVALPWLRHTSLASRQDPTPILLCTRLLTTVGSGTQIHFRTLRCSPPKPISVGRSLPGETASNSATAMAHHRILGFGST